MSAGPAAVPTPPSPWQALHNALRKSLSLSRRADRQARRSRRRAKRKKVLARTVCSCTAASSAVLFGELLGDLRVVAIEILTAQAKADERAHDEAYAPIAMGRFQGRRSMPRSRNGSATTASARRVGITRTPIDRRGAVPVFQPLKNRQVIPLGPRDVLRVGGIGGGAELHRNEECQAARDR